MTDEDSFKNGIGMLNKIPGMLGKTAVGIVGVATAFVAMGASSATALTKLADNAKVLGLSARQLDNWRNAAQIAGGDADAFQDSLSTLNKTFFNLKIGDVDKGMIQSLGMSQADFGKMQVMPMQQKIDYVLARLENISDPDKQKALTLQLLGQNGLTMLAQNQLTGKKFSDAYGNADQRNLYSNKDYVTAISGKKSLDETKVSLEELFNKIGIEIESALLPALQEFSRWLRDNKVAMTDFSEAIGGLVKFVFSVIGDFSKGLGVINARSDFARDVLPSGPAGTGDRLSLMTGIGSTYDIFTETYLNKYTAEQAKNVMGSTTRKNLLESGYAQEAFKLPDAAISALEKLAKGMDQKEYGITSDPMIAKREKEIMFGIKTINLNITTSGPISPDQVNKISSAIMTRGITQ